MEELEDIILSEISQAHLCVQDIKVDLIEVDSRLLVSRGWDSLEGRGRWGEDNYKV
jgi:hypothetical protein